MTAATKQTEAMKLIVKAPNQLIEDQNIDCDLTWTVLNLKEHLSRVYPSKPAIAEQKLIYSGQLLTDDAVLKDILRKYEGQKAHSLHLVCMPPRGTPDTWKKSQSTSQATVQPSQPSVATNQELGQPSSSSQQVNRSTAPVTPIVTERPATASVPSSQGQEGWNWFHATQQQFLAASAAQMPTMAAYPHAAMAHLYDPVNIAQMQQIYSQYMAQYLSRLQQAGVSAEVLGTMHAQAQQNWNVHPNQTPPVAVPDVNPIVPANAANPQANVPAAPQMIGADDDEMRLGRQRDWLDWFYVLSRLLVLFSIVYFYSSLKRFVLVSALGILLYLYHLGYFRMQPIGVAEAENNQLPREAVPEAPVEDQNGPDRAEEQEAVVGEPDGVRQRRHDNANPAEENVPAPNNQALPPPVDTPSAFMLTWTFVTSFFASLIPDRPNVV